MWRMTLCEYHGLVVKALFSRCGGVWTAVSDEILDDYVEDVKNNVVGFQQQASCGAQTNTNESQTASLSNAPSMTREVVFERTPKFHICFQGQKGKQLNKKLHKPLPIM